MHADHSSAGIFIEYQYQWLNIEDADEELIKEINKEGTFGTYPSHDLDLGGHAMHMGIRWHYR